jgi:NADH:ubiquinone reductase (H+-translocating)
VIWRISQIDWEVNVSWSKRRVVGVAGAGIASVVVARRIWKQVDQGKRNDSIRRSQKVVILGAGFAGLSVARELASLLPQDELGEITLIDRNNYLLFTPMLTEVAGGELDPRHIVASPRRLSPRIKFQQATVRGIDLRRKGVTIARGPGDRDSGTIHADHLVIALGSVPNYHHVPGLREHSLGMKSLADAAGIRNRVLSCLERANQEQDAAVRRELLTFVVGGGGYTGVETMAAINDLARDIVREYPRIHAEDIECFIVEPRDRLLEELSPDLAAYAQQKLQERGVQVILRTKITEAGENYLKLESGRQIATRTLIWAGGIKPGPLVEQLDCERGRHGGIVVDEHCAVPKHPGVWALGDCAEVPKAGSQGTHAPTAQNATREGALLARNIVAEMRGEPLQPFTFNPIGELALVGRHSGVAKLYGYHFSGFVAWAMWRAVYLSKMPGMSNRSRIAMDWILDLIYGRDMAEFPTAQSTDLEPVREQVR